MIVTHENFTDRHVILRDFDDGGLTAGRRFIYLYLPEGYAESEAHYPVVYFNDGENTFSGGRARMDVDLAYDSLIEDGLIQPAIFVGIGIIDVAGRFMDFTPTVRGCQYPVRPPGGGLHGYYRFLSERLKPYIDAHYRTKPEPASTGIAGYSLGGLAAFLMAYEHPETFGMAGCMSSSLAWDDDYALRMVQDDTGGKKPVRFWLDGGGSGEYHVWQITARAYGLLEQRGWQAGDDLAAYFDYPAGHLFPAAAGRMRQMLYFLLRKEPLRLEQYRLVYTADPTAPVMDLNTGHRRIVGAEAWYAGGLRLTVPRPDITIADTAVVKRDASEPLLLHAVGAGETVISSSYQGHSASLRVISYDPAVWPQYRMCPRNEGAAPRVDADADSWASLPYTICLDGQTTVVRFGVSYDTAYMHIAATLRGSLPITEPDKTPDTPTGIEFRFDARPESYLCKGDGYTTADQFLEVCITPGKADRQSEMFHYDLDEWGPVVPEEILSASAPVSDGHQMTLSIPTSYIDEMQGGPWEVFRLNIGVNTRGAVDNSLTQTWWQPDWPTFPCPVGAGLFRKG